MAYSISCVINLGASYAGIASYLRAQLFDTAGVNAGSEITTGFTEIGTGTGMYVFSSSSIPDGIRGGIKIYFVGMSTAPLIALAINPEDLEYIEDLETSKLDEAGIAEAVRDVSNTSPADGSLGDIVNEIKGVVTATDTDIRVVSLVVRYNGNPVANVMVTAALSATPTVLVATQVTDSNGRVIFMLPAGTYSIRRQHASYTFTDPQPLVVT